MNADGTNQTGITDNPASDEAPAWSPDGSKIAFDTGREGNEEIYVMNTDGTKQIRLTHNFPSGFPAWSPDGSKIAFTSDRDGNEEIYVMGADGSNQTRLTHNPTSDLPAWSPDGSKIAFTSDRDGNPEIYVMNADGTDQTHLTGFAHIDFGDDDDEPTVKPELAETPGHRASLPAHLEGFENALAPPPGVQALIRVTIDGQDPAEHHAGEYKAYMLLETDMPLSMLMEHYQRQVVQPGWEVQQEVVTEGLAVLTWTFHD